MRVRFSPVATALVGPLITTAALLQWGLKGTLVLTVPVCIMALIIVAHFKELAVLGSAAGRKKAETKSGANPDEWGPFVRLNVAAVCRSILFYGLNTFIPLYWIHVLNQSKAAGGTARPCAAAAGRLPTRTKVAAGHFRRTAGQTSWQNHAAPCTLAR